MEGASTAVRVRLVEAAPGEDAGEEFLGAFASGIFIAAFASKEAEDRLVIGFTESAEGGAGFR